LCAFGGEKSEIGRKMIPIKKVINLIKKYDLKLAITRNISLFLLTCLALGYTQEMTKRFGFSYQAIAITGNQETFTDYLNIQLLSEGMKTYLQKHTSLEKIFNPLLDQFPEFKEKTNRLALSYIDPYKALSMVIEFTPRFFSVLGFYNAYWRYLDTLKQEALSPLTERIGRERNQFASLYPEIEKIIIGCAEKIGKKQGFNGALFI